MLNKILCLTKFLLITLLLSCNPKTLSLNLKKQAEMEIYETSASGHKLTQLSNFKIGSVVSEINLNVEDKLQTITGFGGAFTESSAHLLNQMSFEKKDQIINAYFSNEGAAYSLTRTHMNSCDFSLSNYSYAEVEEDIELKHFSIDHDRNDLIPMIKAAQSASKDGFKLFASPWTASPWMKDNNSWVGGKLKPEYYKTWALFFSKYANAYKNEGIVIWGFTVENEPMGNGNNWESMIFSPDEMTYFVKKYLGPTLESNGQEDLVILGFDQNRGDLKEWVDVMYKNEANSKYYDGTAIHWYESTYDYFPKELQYAHQKAPNKYLIQSEACIDSEVPAWKDDDWYWSKQATDWGFDWREPAKKYLHPKYAPVNRYARDIIGCLNNWVDGWVDWNMVLDRQGGPNWFKNWCVAPIIVDTELDEVYLTPLYYVMSHFSKFIRPGAQIIKVQNTDNDLMVSACKNPDDSVVVVVFNEGQSEKYFNLNLSGHTYYVSVSSQAIQTIILKN